jgi:NADH dehydrogenase
VKKAIQHFPEQVASRPFHRLRRRFSGVETAGELVDCLKSIRRYYPRVNKNELKVTLLQDLPRLLPGLSEKLGHAAHQSLVARGVAVRIGTRASAVCEKGVLLSGNEFLNAGTVLCTIGTRPNPLIERTLLAVERDSSSMPTSA